MIEIPPVPEQMTIADALALARTLRVQACLMSARIVDLIALASGGEIHLDLPGPTRCPGLHQSTAP